MRTLSEISFLIWAIFIVYWGVSALDVKKNIKRSTWARSFAFRIVFVVALIFVLQNTAAWQVLGYHFNYATALVGIVLMAAGVGFAIWARWHLGRNWSGTPTMKEGHELVTSGPYRFVRHPIYTGMALALIGSALVNGVAWIIVFVIFSVIFIMRIPVEEKYMMQLFPTEYPEYKKNTKALIPFVW